MRVFLNSRGGRGLLLTLGYLALTLAYTYPLLMRFTGFVFAGMEDGSMSVWNLWWFRYSIFTLHQSPMHTDFLFYPSGVSLVFHSLPKVLAAASVPFQYLFGLTIAYNLIVVATFVLSGLTMYWLVRYLTGERLPAFLAGALFAFSPFRLDQRPHLQLLSTMLIPVFVLLLFKAREALPAGGRRPWLYFALAGVSLGVMAYDTEYYSIFLLLFAVFFALFFFPFRLRRADLKLWLRLVGGLALAVVILAIIYLPMLLAAAGELTGSGDYVNFPAVRMTDYSASLVSFIVPPVTSQFLSGPFDFVNHGIVKFSDTTFIGYTALILAAIGLIRYRRRRGVWFWAAAFGVSVLLALGPYLVLHDHASDIRMPFIIFTKIPLLSSVRVPARLAVLISLCVSVLAGYGLAAVFSWLRRAGGQWLRVGLPAMAAVVLAVMFIEYRVVPDLTSTDFPAVYQQIAQSDIQGSVMSIPMGWEAGSDTTGLETTVMELFQSQHERPLVGGMVARAPKDDIFRGIYTPVVDFLADPIEVTPSDLDRDPTAIARFRQKYDVAFIVVHKQTPEFYFRDQGFTRTSTELTPQALANLDGYITRYLGMERFAETDEVLAYRRT